MSVLIGYPAIKEAVKMETVLDAYGVEIKRGGVAICPFHADRHPSMKVYRDGYYCFSCGAGGDVFTFVARMDGLPNREAAIRVAAIGGLELPEDDLRGREKARRAAAKRRQEKREKQALEERYDSLCDRVRRLREIKADGLPGSGEWLDAVNLLPALEGELDELFERLGKLD